MKLSSKHNPHWLYLSAIVCLGMLSITHAQAQQSNPLELDPRAARAGGAIFRAQCATCHGADAKGIESIEAPDLTLIWTRNESSDSAVFQTIQNGIPGSIMPPHGFPETEIWMLVSYLKSVRVGGSTELYTGDASDGGRLFASNCVTCHRAGEGGGSLGPDLTTITAQRSRQAMISSVRNPSASIGRGYRPVTLLTNSGRRIHGTIKGEDAFSIQIMDSNQRLLGFAKSDLLELDRETESLMPSFVETELSNSELEDILSYLNRQRQ